MTDRHEPQTNTKPESIRSSRLRRTVAGVIAFGVLSGVALSAEQIDDAAEAAPVADPQFTGILGHMTLTVNNSANTCRTEYDGSTILSESATLSGVQATDGLVYIGVKNPITGQVEKYWNGSGEYPATPGPDGSMNVGNQALGPTDSKIFHLSFQHALGQPEYASYDTPVAVVMACPQPEQPGTTAPGTTVPVTTAPGTTVPGSPQPGGTVPETKPGTPGPGSITPFATKPDSLAVVNLTADQMWAPGFLQIGVGGDKVGAFSSLNGDHSGQTVASATIVHTGADSKAWVYNQSGGREIVDVQGFLSPEAFESVTPVRILDTRNSSPEAVAAGSITTLMGEPNRTAIINLAATDTKAPGFVQVLKEPGQAVGGYSNLNIDHAGQIVNRLAFVSFDANGEAFLYNQSPTQLVGDLFGYMKPGAFEAANERVLDTRLGSGQIPGSHSLTVFKGRPNSTAVVSAVATEALGPGFIQFMDKKSGVIGSTSAFNVEKAGQTVGNVAFVHFDESGEAVAFTQGGAHLVLDVLGYMANASFEDIQDQRVLNTA